MNKIGIVSLVIFTALAGCVDKAVEIQTRVVDQSETVCRVIKKPLEKHMIAVIDNGDKLLASGGDEVLVTGTELSDTYDGACR